MKAIILLIAGIMFFGCAGTQQETGNSGTQSAPAGGGEVSAPAGNDNAGNGTANPVADAKGRLILPSELAGHDGGASCWVRYVDQVHDITGYLAKHPGGEVMILELCGESDDSFTNAFLNQHPDPEFLVSLMDEGTYIGYME